MQQKVYVICKGRWLCRQGLGWNRWRGRLLRRPAGNSRQPQGGPLCVVRVALDVLQEQRVYQRWALGNTDNNNFHCLFPVRDASPFWKSCVITNQGMTALLFVWSRQRSEYGHWRRRFSCYRQGRSRLVELWFPEYSQKRYAISVLETILLRIEHQEVSLVRHSCNQHDRQHSSKHLCYIQSLGIHYEWINRSKSDQYRLTMYDINKRPHSVLNGCYNLLTNNWINN